MAIDLHPGQARLNEIEAAAREWAEVLEPVMRNRRFDGEAWMGVDPDLVAQHRVASDIKRLVMHIKSDPDLLNRVVRVLAA